MRVMVIGSGGREHALAWKISLSPLVGSREDLLCVPGNPGMDAVGLCVPGPEKGMSDVKALADLAEALQVDLAVVGPELPLALGISDEMQRRGLAVFGPTARAARLEGSKVFAKEFMRRHGIPTAGFEVFTEAAKALDYLSSSSARFPIVVKADGLAAGKGVVIAGDRAEAEAAVRSMLEQRKFGAAGESIVIEECLEGVEASFFALTDGERIVPLASCQDYKRALDGDRGPNTGGMGAYCPSIEIDEPMRRRIFDQAIVPVVRGMAEEGHPYRGIIYAGLMLSASGRNGTPDVKVLEYNVRFGDPETQALLPRMDSDLLPLLHAAATGDLSGDRGRVCWRTEWSACVVIASRGYPESSEKGRPIDGLDRCLDVAATEVFHAGTRRGPGGVETAGGRVLAVSSLGIDLQEALRRAYDGVSRISFDGMQYRLDIGRGAMSRLGLHTSI